LASCTSPPRITCAKLCCDRHPLKFPVQHVHRKAMCNIRSMSTAHIHARTKECGIARVKVTCDTTLNFQTGLAEIAGGWLVWQCLREKRPWYYFVAGGCQAMLSKTRKDYHICQSLLCKASLHPVSTLAVGIGLVPSFSLSLSISW
jgi:hypothetical protein